MTGLVFRCSSLGRLMTEPKTKGEGILSVGAKSYIRELFAQDLYGVDFEISGKALDKGNLCEQEAIGLLNGVRGLMLEKNTERRCNGLITGECDLIDVDNRRGHDLKCSWSMKTHPLCIEDVESSQRKTYEWQMRGYLMLWPEADEWEVNHCLVSTPDHLIGYEDPKVHIVDHIDARLRITTWAIKRDKELEDLIRTKVQAAQEYYTAFAASFDASINAQR